MYAIITHHVLIFGNIFKKYDKYKELILMNTTCYWHVRIYALISGYIGYKTNKYSTSTFYFFWKFKPNMTQKIQLEDFFLLTLLIIGILLNILECIYFYLWLIKE
jgi:hypothetical protein